MLLSNFQDHHRGLSQSSEAGCRAQMQPRSQGHLHFQNGGRKMHFPPAILKAEQDEVGSTGTFIPDGLT